MPSRTFSTPTRTHSLSFHFQCKGHGKAGDGKCGYAIGRVCGRELVDGSFCEGKGDSASLQVKPSGQTQWRCKECASDRTIPRNSSMWVDAVTLHNALPTTMDKIKIDGGGGGGGGR